MVCLGRFVMQGPFFKSTADVRVRATGGSDEKTIRGSTLKLDGTMGKLGGFDWLVFQDDKHFSSTQPTPDLHYFCPLI